VNVARPLTLLLPLVILGACGGDSNEERQPTATSSAAATGTTAPTDAPAVTPTPEKSLAAIDLVPNLTEIGLVQIISETIDAPFGLDIAFSEYSGTGIVARAEVRVYESEQQAATDFSMQAAGWKNPPAKLFGGDPGNEDSAPLVGLVDAAAYLSTLADAQGNQIWTDVYRVGRVIVISHVLGRAGERVNEVRFELAESVLVTVN